MVMLFRSTGVEVSICLFWVCARMMCGARRGVGELEYDLLTSPIQGDLAWYIMLDQSPP